MNIYTINISAETPETDTFFHELSMNRFPIIAFSELDPDEFVKDEDFLDIVKKYMKTKNVFLTAFINMRVIQDEDTKDRVFKVRDIMNIPDDLS